jgi:hypothetical protein
MSLILLILLKSVKKFYKYKVAVLNILAQGDQLYRAFPFSEYSLDLALVVFLLLLLQYAIRDIRI